MQQQFWRVSTVVQDSHCTVVVVILRLAILAHKRSGGTGKMSSLSVDHNLHVAACDVSDYSQYQYGTAALQVALSIEFDFEVCCWLILPPRHIFADFQCRLARPWVGIWQGRRGLSRLTSATV